MSHYISMVYCEYIISYLEGISQLHKREFVAEYCLHFIITVIRLKFIELPIFLKYFNTASSTTYIKRNLFLFALPY